MAAKTTPSNTRSIPAAPVPEGTALPVHREGVWYVSSTTCKILPGVVGVASDNSVWGLIMKLKKTLTPPTTGPPQLAEVVLVAAALQ